MGLGSNPRLGGSGRCCRIPLDADSNGLQTPFPPGPLSPRRQGANRKSTPVGAGLEDFIGSSQVIFVYFLDGFAIFYQTGLRYLADGFAIFPFCAAVGIVLFVDILTIIHFGS